MRPLAVRFVVWTAPTGLQLCTSSAVPQQKPSRPLPASPDDSLQLPLRVSVHDDSAPPPPPFSPFSMLPHCGSIYTKNARPQSTDGPLPASIQL